MSELINNMTDVSKKRTADQADLVGPPKPGSLVGPPKPPELKKPKKKSTSHCLATVRLASVGVS